MARRKPTPNQTYFTQLMPESDWTPPALRDLPSTWADAKRVAIDIEAKDPDLEEMGPGVRRKDTSEICGISFAIEDGPAYYLPIAHEGGGNLPREQVLAYIRDRVREYRRVIVGANFSYDMDWLMEEGVDFSGVAKILDPCIADPLINEYHFSYKLDVIAQRRGFAGKDEKILNAAAACANLHPKRELYKLHSKYVGAYGEQDVRLPLEIIRDQEKDIERENLHEVFQLETDVLPILVQMRRKGIPVDLNHVDRVESWCNRKEREYERRVLEITGKRFTSEEVWQKDEVLIPLLKGAGLTIPMSSPEPKYDKKTQTMVTKPAKEQVLKSWLTALEHPIGKVIADFREVVKLRKDFCSRVRKFAIRHSDGVYRVHCTFNQLRLTRDEDNDSDDERTGKGTRTGRLSMSEYNAQQEPMRSLLVVEGEPEFDHLPQGRTTLNKKGQLVPDPWLLGAAWRCVYRAEDGMIWCSGDYSQQEPRLECHFAEKSRLDGAKRAGDLWRANPRLDGHQLVADLTGLSRDIAKQIRLGLAYGMGGAKLCKLYLKKPTIFKPYEWGEMKGQIGEHAGPEGQAILDAFFRGAPYIKQLAKLAAETGKARGYIITVGGRHIRAARFADGSINFRLLYQLGNGLMQGGGASQTKMAMVALHRDGADLRLQVHDEINWMDQCIRQAKRRAEMMQDVFPMTVPSVVDLEASEYSYGRIGELDVELMAA